MTSRHIRALLDSRGISIAELARAIGANRPTLSEMLTNDRDPKLSTAAKIAAFLGVTVDRVAFGDCLPAEARCCGTCDAFATGSGDDGECRRNAPVAGADHRWPPAEAMEWCGAHDWADGCRVTWEEMERESEMVRAPAGLRIQPGSASRPGKIAVLVPGPIRELAQEDRIWALTSSQAEAAADSPSGSARRKRHA